MRYSKMLLWAVMAAGVMITGVQAKAQQFYGENRDAYRDRQDLRYDHRELRFDNVREDGLRGRIAADRFRLNEDIRCGRRWAAQQDAQILQRDEAAFNWASRDMRHDRFDTYNDRRDVRRDSWR